LNRSRLKHRHKTKQEQDLEELLNSRKEVILSTLQEVHITIQAKIQRMKMTMMKRMTIWETRITISNNHTIKIRSLRRQTKILLNIIKTISWITIWETLVLKEILLIIRIMPMVWTIKLKSSMTQITIQMKSLIVLIKITTKSMTTSQILEVVAR
jgi:hypothetical protein